MNPDTYAVMHKVEQLSLLHGVEFAAVPAEHIAGVVGGEKRLGSGGRVAAHACGSCGERYPKKQLAIRQYMRDAGCDKPCCKSCREVSAFDSKLHQQASVHCQPPRRRFASC